MNMLSFCVIGEEESTLCHKGADFLEEGGRCGLSK
jgi:hypothetical protein